MHPNQLDGFLQTVTDMGVRAIKSFNEEDGARVFREVFSEVKEDEEEKEEKRAGVRTIPAPFCNSLLLTIETLYLSN